MANHDNASNAGKTIKDSARDAADEVKQGASKLASGAKEAWDEATDGSAAERVKQDAADLAKTVRDKGAEAMDTAREMGRNTPSAPRTRPAACIAPPTAASTRSPTRPRNITTNCPAWSAATPRRRWESRPGSGFWSA